MRWGGMRGEECDGLHIINIIMIRPPILIII